MPSSAAARYIVPVAVVGWLVQFLRNTAYFPAGLPSKAYWSVYFVWYCLKLWQSVVQTVWRRMNPFTDHSSRVGSKWSLKAEIIVNVARAATENAYPDVEFNKKALEHAFPKPSPTAKHSSSASGNNSDTDHAKVLNASSSSSPSSSASDSDSVRTSQKHGMRYERVRLPLNESDAWLLEGREVYKGEGKQRELMCEWMHPTSLSLRQQQQAPVVIFFHGGAYSFCSIATHRDMTSFLAKRANCRLLSVAYRLAPEYPFPCALIDALAVYRWVTLDPDGPRVAADRVFFSGDSAGGGLSVALGLLVRDIVHGTPLLPLKVHESLSQQLQPPAGIMAMSPWCDLNCSEGLWENDHESFDYLPRGTSAVVRDSVSTYVGPYALDHPYISMVKADSFRGLPPLLLQVGGAERIRDDVLTLAHYATNDGVDCTLQVFEHLFHVFQAFRRFVPEAYTAIDNIARFVAEKASVEEADGAEVQQMPAERKISLL
jgi:monoterpene epsilon-lactone hydrolase